MPPSQRELHPRMLSHDEMPSADDCKPIPRPSRRLPVRGATSEGREYEQHRPRENHGVESDGERIQSMQQGAASGEGSSTAGRPLEPSAQRLRRAQAQPDGRRAHAEADEIAISAATAPFQLRGRAHRGGWNMPWSSGNEIS